MEEGSTGLDFIRALLRYLAQVASTDRLSETDLRQAVSQALSGGGELKMTIAEQWEQQGMEKGRQEGEAQGPAAAASGQVWPAGAGGGSADCGGGIGATGTPAGADSTGERPGRAVWLTPCFG